MKIAIDLIIFVKRSTTEFSQGPEHSSDLCQIISQVNVFLMCLVILFYKLNTYFGVWNIGNTYSVCLNGC